MRAHFSATNNKCHDFMISTVNGTSAENLRELLFLNTRPNELETSTLFRGVVSVDEDDGKVISKHAKQSKNPEVNDTNVETDGTEYANIEVNAKKTVCETVDGIQKKRLTVRLEPIENGGGNVRETKGDKMVRLLKT